MNAYIYQADLWCEDCALKIRRELPVNTPKDDSGDWPQGPYDDGGGEADQPCHCAGCEVFLENPLTSGGEAAVKEMFAEFMRTGSGRLEILRAWSSYYDIPLDGSVLNDEEYTQRGGVICPVCHRTDGVTSTSDLEVSYNTAFQDIECSNCGSSWTDEYELVRYSHLTNGHTG